MITLTFTGNIGFDAVQEAQNGSKPYIRFTVAVNEKRKGIETTTWITVFTRNERLLPYLKKGTRVMVIGRGSMKSYYSTKLVEHQVDISVSAYQIELLGGTRQEQPADQLYGQRPPAPQPASAAGQASLPGLNPQEQPAAPSNMDPDDLPF